MLSIEESQFWFRLGGVLASLGVGFEAYGAHGFPKRLEREKSGDKEKDTKRVDQFRTGSKYHLLHSIALFLVPFSRHPLITGSLFLSGVTVFSGTLYIISHKPKYASLGRFTPIGGLLLMAAWLSFAA